MTASSISGNSRRMARNTALLYVRMLLMMFIGLFTSRVVLRSLGVDDYGTYNVVYSVVMMFTVISGSISTSISRFLAFELGKKDAERLHKVFKSAVLIQAGMSLLLILLAETLGLWYFKTKLIIPAGREVAAMWVYQSSVLYLIIQLFSIPFNCTIIAHEQMQAFAWISILEAVLKLLVAFTLFFAWGDKLITYAILVVCVALIVRSSYAAYCRRHFEEVRGGLVLDWGVIKDILSLGAWSSLAYGVGAFNTQGVNLLSNSFFGVRINAARGIASQVENIVRQFVTNFLMALNPQITKTWASGGKDYCFEIVRKGCKFSYLIVLIFAVPFWFEADFILRLWLGTVPEYAAEFTRLAIICVMTDMMSNSTAQLILAQGKVALYYVTTSLVSACVFAGSWLAFSNGMPAKTAYIISISVYTIISLLRLVFVKKNCGFTLKPFVGEVIMPLLLASAVAVAITSIAEQVIDKGMAGSLICIAVSGLSAVSASYFLALTKGEKKYVIEIITRKKWGK